MIGVVCLFVGLFAGGRWLVLARVAAGVVAALGMM
jgi:hypothetical protein